MKKSIFWIVIVIFGVLFYWFQVRPARIRSDCGFEPTMLYDKNENAGMTYEEFYDFYYKKCLNQHGLSK